VRTRFCAIAFLLGFAGCDVNPNLGGLGQAPDPVPASECRDPIVFISPVSCIDDPRCGNVVVDLTTTPPEARVVAGNVGRLSPRQRICPGLVTASYRIVAYHSSDPAVATAQPLVPDRAITECIVTALTPGQTMISATITSPDFPQAVAPLAFCTGTCDDPVTLVLRVVP
jgi:hypothetical protein